jgi:hypothetical protein
LTRASRLGEHSASLSEMAGTSPRLSGSILVDVVHGVDSSAF